MHSSSETASAKVPVEKDSIDEILNPADGTKVLTLFEDGKFVLPALKRVMDAILVRSATEINFSSIHPYYIFKRGIRNENNPLVEGDILSGGCCHPNMDCVGSAHYIRNKIITFFKRSDTECTFRNNASANHSRI